MTQSATQVSVSAPARCAWVDVARVVSILLVGASHQYLGGNYFNAYPAGAGVAVFFFLSGYFFPAGRFSKCIVRVGGLLICYCFWSTVYLFLKTHGRIDSASQVLENLLYGGGVYWFIRALLVAFMVGAVVVHLRPVCRWAVLLVCLAMGVQADVRGAGSHVYTILPMGLFAFLGGVETQCVSIRQLGAAVLPVPESRVRVVWGGALLLCIAMVVATYMGWRPAPRFLSTSLLAWGLLVVCAAGSRIFPRAAGIVAVAGPAAVLFYVLHHLVIISYTSAWVHMGGEFPPLWVDLGFLILFMSFCAFAMSKIRGKSRILDAVFFARLSRPNNK